MPKCQTGPQGGALFAAAEVTSSTSSESPLWGSAAASLVLMMNSHEQR